MKAKQMPLAPQRATCGKSAALTRPVARAVTAMIPARARDPYFSSSSGPKSRTYTMLPTRCAQPECPSTWVNRRRYVSGLSSEER